MEIICRVGIFMICAQVLVHFRPNKSYEKYFKMLVSSMILMQFILPINQFLSDKGEEDFEEIGAVLEQSLWIPYFEMPSQPAFEEVYEMDMLNREEITGGEEKEEEKRGSIEEIEEIETIRITIQPEGEAHAENGAIQSEGD